MLLRACLPFRAAALKMLLSAFDRNGNGKLDAEERPPLIRFPMKRDEQQAK